ncbi:hypothetical protein D3C73_1314270 [compost metagenome]
MVATTSVLSIAPLPLVSPRRRIGDFTVGSKTRLAVNCSPVTSSLEEPIYAFLRLSYKRVCWLPPITTVALPIFISVYMMYNENPCV